MKHTPTPWFVNLWTTGRRTIQTDGGLVIAEIHQTHVEQERQGNAEFIVKAVNAHEKLVKICEETLATLRPTSDVAEGLRQVIAKTKGEG